MSPSDWLIAIFVMSVALYVWKTLFDTRTDLERRAMDMLRRIPGPKYTLPVFGDTFRLLGDPKTILTRALKLVRSYGPVFVFWVGSSPVVILVKPEDIEAVLNNPKNSNKPSKFYSLLEWVFGNGLLILNGEKWQLHRKAITPAFHFGVLQKYVQIFLDQAESLCEELASLCDGREFDILPCIGVCSNRTVCDTSFGLPTDKLSHKEREDVITFIETASEIVQDRVFHPWLMCDFIFHLTASSRKLLEAYAHINQCAEKTIRNRKRTIEESSTGIEKEDEHGIRNHLSFIDLMLTNTDTISLEELVGEVHTIMAAQHTSTLAESFVLQMLALHPKVQERALADIQDIWSNSKLSLYEKFQSMSYLDLVIKETLRLFPPVPTFSRQTVSDVKLPSGYDIPAGSDVLIAGYVTHRDPAIYPNPEEFDPDRYLPENSLKRHNYAFLPFGAGSRNCIGQKYAKLQMKAVLSTILRHYEVLPPKDGPTRVIDIRVTCSLMLSSVDGHYVRLVKRCAPVI